MSYEGTAAIGIPLIGQGTGNKTKFGTAVIAGGGTNATSFSTSSGIVKYDGTSLVTSSTAQIDATNIRTNTSQPCFFAYNANAVANATGDGTVYTCQFDTEVFDQGNNFSSNTFTAPVTGKYIFSAGMSISNISSAYSQLRFDFLYAGNQSFPLLIQPQVWISGTTIKYTGTIIVSLAATNTVIVRLFAIGSTKTVTWNGAAIGASPPYFSGALLC